MSSPRRVHELPLLSMGLPQVLSDWLHLAGVPVVPADSPQARMISGGNSAAQLLLYDSRNQETSRELQRLQGRGVRAVDTSTVWERGPAVSTNVRSVQQIRSRVLELLKVKIEQAGGLWLRLADYPFPFQSAACCGTEGACTSLSRLAAAFESLPVYFAETIQAACRPFATSNYFVDRPSKSATLTGDTTSSTDIESWVRRRYAQGLPMAIFSDESAIEGNAPFDSQRLPLLWRTTFEQFATWWQQRAAISFRAHCRGNVIHLDCDDLFGNFPPMLELWRGNHLASFRLQQGQMTVRADGLVFQQEHNRHPVGFAPIWAEPLAKIRNHAKSPLRSA